MFDSFGDLLRRVGLFLDNPCHNRYNCVEFAYGSRDLFNLFHGVRCGFLNRGDLRLDPLGRIGGLPGQIFNLIGHDCNPFPASPARAASIVAFRANKLV